MLMPLLIGCATVFITMSIQVSAVVMMLRYLYGLVSSSNSRSGIRSGTSYIISTVMILLFVGHIIQIAIWAVLFKQLGEFSDFQTAFYHSMVNFASLGYGDIVMSEHWRLLGAIEASTGVLMFGLSAGVMLSIMNYVLAHDDRFRALRSELNKHNQNDS